LSRGFRGRGFVIDSLDPFATLPAIVTRPAAPPLNHDYNPWTYPAPEHTTPEQIEAQLQYQRELAERCDTHFSSGVFISPLAALFCRNLTLGENSYIAAYCYVTDELLMGSNCSMNVHCVSRGAVQIGNDVRIGAYSAFIAVNHRFDDTGVPIRRQGIEEKPIRIGDNVWIGSNVTILAGVSIGSHSVIGAGAVVTRDVSEYSIAVGNPARVIRNRRTKKSGGVATTGLEEEVASFGKKAAEQWQDIIGRFEFDDPKMGPCYQGKVGIPNDRSLRRTADAIEIAAMFGSLPPLRSREEFAGFFQQVQDPETGIFFDPWVDENRGDSKRLECRTSAYNFLTAGYALELLNASPLYPIAILGHLPPPELIDKLNSLPWHDAAWGAGAWIDHYATAAYLQKKYFQPDFALETLFGWLQLHADSFSGMWGRPLPDQGWLQAVNGFYRMTRGAHAQFGIPLPHPERTIDTVLAHASDIRYFGESRKNACNFLDVIHPLWLCANQTDYRKAEASAWVREQLRTILKKWREGEGFGFILESGNAPQAQASLQGTEMWLSIIFLMGDYLGISSLLGYQPQGVHRIKIGLPLGQG